MPDLTLSEKLLAGLAGWDVVKQARTIVAENRARAVAAAADECIMRA